MNLHDGLAFLLKVNDLCSRQRESRCLGYHLKTGHTLSVQNRPTRLAEDVIVLPCRSVRLQG
jgi:hypothetical protein